MRISQEILNTVDLNLTGPLEESKECGVVDEMIADPLAAQLTLQFAVNMYAAQDQQRFRQSNMSPYLSNALQNLALFRRELLSSNIDNADNADQLKKQLEMVTITDQQDQTNTGFQLTEFTKLLSKSADNDLLLSKSDE